MGSQRVKTAHEELADQIALQEARERVEAREREEAQLRADKETVKKHG